MDGALVGWASHLPGEPFVLDDLWVDPAAMEPGVGSRLFRHVADHARTRGAPRLEWDAEPNAVGFYEKLGGRHVGMGEPGVWGRSLPRMALDLGPLPEPCPASSAPP